MMPAIRDFKNEFASSAFRSIDDDSAIVGKYGRIIQLDNGVFDVWFVGPNLTPLGGRRLATIRRNLSQEGTFHELTGEGWIQGRGREFVLTCAPLLGIKRKRRVSEATIDRLAQVRPARAPAVEAAHA
jgi:hypothetical protein